MDEPKSRVVNVIETRTGNNVKYFTLEGVLIGELEGGARLPKKNEKAPAPMIRTGIANSLSPKQIRRQKELDAEKLIDPKARAKHLAKNVA